MCVSLERAIAVSGRTAAAGCLAAARVLTSSACDTIRWRDAREAQLSLLVPGFSCISRCSCVLLNGVGMVIVAVADFLARWLGPFFAPAGRIC